MLIAKKNICGTVENKNILIFKNDRAGDLVSSVKLISELKKRKNNIKIYLSNLNYNFNFLIPGCNLIKTNINLKFVDKIKIIIDIIKNNYDEIFILSPKNFYFFLPILFRKIKFYAIVINGKKRNRPSYFLRKFLHKISIRYRTKINKENIIQSNLSLINGKEEFNVEVLNLEEYGHAYLKYLSNNYVYFQFKKSFFEKLNWNIKELEIILKYLEQKFDKVIFSSDIEDNEYDKYFDENYTSIDFENNFFFSKKNEKNIIHLKKIDPKNLFLIIKNANQILSPHGLVTQISYLLKKRPVNLFNFKINNKNEYHHEKISFSEWYSNMGIKFIFLNSDIKKALRKISKFV